MSAQLRVVDKETSAFEAARARWERVSTARRALREKLDGAQAALALTENPPSKGDVVSPVIAEKACRYLADRRANAALLRQEVVRLEDELTQAGTAHAIESAAWRLAVEDEARRRAEAVRPKHREAVKRIARLVEELSAAVDAERAVRAELAEVGSAGVLPDAGREFGSLHEYSSLVSSWNRRLLAEGAFD
jgi:hypothetical protein